MVGCVCPARPPAPAWKGEGAVHTRVSCPSSFCHSLTLLQSEATADPPPLPGLDVQACSFLAQGPTPPSSWTFGFFCLERHPPQHAHTHASIAICPHICIQSHTYPCTPRVHTCLCAHMQPTDVHTHVCSHTHANVHTHSHSSPLAFWASAWSLPTSWAETPAAPTMGPPQPCLPSSTSLAGLPPSLLVLPALSWALVPAWALWALVPWAEGGPAECTGVRQTVASKLVCGVRTDPGDPGPPPWRL